MNYHKYLKSLLCITLFLLSNQAIAACISNESESNDSLSQANSELCSSQVLAGSIRNKRDVDWFELNADAGNIEINLNHSNRDDFDIELYNQSGSLIAQATSSNLPETLSTSLSGGNYFVKISRYRGTGWYDLSAQFNQSGGNEPPPPGCTQGSRPSKPNNLTNWLTGSSIDVCPNINGNQGVLLMGGNFDVDEAFINRVKPRISGGDVVVIRTSGSDGYNSYLQNLLASDSVETLLVDSRSKANSDYVDWVIRSAEFVFIAGGDQADYLNQWQGTNVESALASVYAKGGIIGGTSAGAMVQGEWIYDPDGIYSVYSDEAVTDPCHQYINMSNNFLNTPYLQNTIVDTHFQQRDRMGRLAAFMSQRASGVTGIGVDEDTSIFIDSSGYAVVDGDNSVYILTEENSTNLVQGQCGQALIYEDIYRYRLSVGDYFNFANGQSSVNATLISIDGRNNSFYSPNNPY